LNLRPLGYEPSELPNCATPRRAPSTARAQPSNCRGSAGPRQIMPPKANRLPPLRLAALLGGRGAKGAPLVRLGWPEGGEPAAAAARWTGTCGDDASGGRVSGVRGRPAGHIPVPGPACHLRGSAGSGDAKGPGRSGPHRAAQPPASGRDSDLAEAVRALTRSQEIQLSRYPGQTERT
jgi:hypothetical protein